MNDLVIITAYVVTDDIMHSLGHRSHVLAQITDAEVDRAYAEGGHPYASQPLPEVRNELRAWLARRALHAAVARWVGVLRGRTTVRILL